MPINSKKKANSVNQIAYDESRANQSYLGIKETIWRRSNEWEKGQKKYGKGNKNQS
jgi:hypothetical protein